MIDKKYLNKIMEQLIKILKIIMIEKFVLINKLNI